MCKYSRRTRLTEVAFSDTARIVLILNAIFKLDK